MKRVLLWLLLALPAGAETLAVQGRLTNAGGGVDGQYPMTFRVFAGETGGAPTFQEVELGVPVIDGVFSTLLGDQTTLTVSAMDGDELWLEVAIGTDPPLPRVRMSHVARAFVADRSHDVACTGCITPEKTSFMACPDSSILVREAGAWGCAPRPSGQDFALSNQTCPVGQVLRGFKADGTSLCVVDKDTTYSGANFATSGNGCPPGLVMTGVDFNGLPTCAPDKDTTYSGANFATSGNGCPLGQVMNGVGQNGLPTCAPDKDTTYSGANFATSGQACAPGQVVRGINASGQAVCDADKDTTYTGADFALSNKVCPTGTVQRGTDGAGLPVCEANPTYTGANFALSNKSCGVGSVVTGIDAAGSPVCAPDKDTTYSGATFALSNKTCGAGQVMKGISTTGDPICVADANTGNNGCYTHWGAWGCATGYDEVVQGRPGGVEAYETAGSLMGNVECVSNAAPAKQSWTGTYNNRLMYSDVEGDGMVKVASRCSLCCSGGCYVALGVTGCAAGYAPTLTGRTGGVEAYDGNGSYGRSLCVDTTSPTYTWPSGYSSRLMRHRESAGSGANGMDFVENVCAICCRQ